MTPESIKSRSNTCSQVNFGVINPYLDIDISWNAIWIALRLIKNGLGYGHKSERKGRCLQPCGVYIAMLEAG